MNIPKDYKLVPVEPTDDMRDAGNVFVLSRAILFESYRAMLAAAPTPPQPIYDEATELEIFEAWYEGYTKQGWSVSKAGTRAAWLACAQSRAKSVEVGHE